MCVYRRTPHAHTRYQSVVVWARSGADMSSKPTAVMWYGSHARNRGATRKYREPHLELRRQGRFDLKAAGFHFLRARR